MAAASQHGHASFMHYPASIARGDAAADLGRARCFSAWPCIIRASSVHHQSSVTMAMPQMI
eukprot:44842-Pelagomonas_calceolata.AAC.2